MDYSEILIKADCANVQMTYLLDLPLVISCLGGAIMNIIYEWTSTLLNFPEAPHGN